MSFLATITAYCLGPCSACSTQGRTATGTRAIRGAAVPRTSPLRLGQRVWIKGFGWVRVDDRLPRGRANRIDLRFGSHSRALAWGKQKRWVRVGR